MIPFLSSSTRPIPGGWDGGAVGRTAAAPGRQAGAKPLNSPSQVRWPMLMGK
jgi:hypothetical protein